jgi:tetratricopeptide (TPR) repeat protein
MLMDEPSRDFLESEAEKAEESGNLELALKLWKDLTEGHPTPTFFSRYGLVAQAQERWDEAENAFSRALRLDPSFAPAMEGMGHLWASRTDKSDDESLSVAKDWFLKALRRERTARTLTFLGSTYRALGETAAAGDAFAHAIALDPNYEEALYNLATSIEAQDPPKSVELLERAIAIDPNYFAAHQELGKLYHKVGDLPRAEYHFRRSLEIDPSDYWSLLYLANTLAVQGKNAEAEQSYLSAIRLHPEKKEGAEFLARFRESG